MGALYIALFILGLILVLTSSSWVRLIRLWLRHLEEPVPALAHKTRPEQAFDEHELFSGAGRERIEVEARRQSKAPPKVTITLLDMVYGIAMLCGIFAKEIWDNLNQSGAVRVQIPHLIGAVLVSPIIYATVATKFVAGELSLIGLAVAFQNGFFWQTVFRTSQGTT